MKIFTRRNALVGWVVLRLALRESKKKGKKAARSGSGGSGRGGLLAKIGGAVVAGLAAIAGAFFVWRRRGSGGEA